MKKVFLSLAVLCVAFALSAQEQGSPISLTQETFKQKVMNYKPGNNEWNYLGDKPCIIDFWASWCGPCRMLAPHIESVAKKFAGQIYVYKVDTQRENELAALFQITSIPSLLFVPMSGTPIMLRGYRDASQLEMEINKYLLQK